MGIVTFNEEALTKVAPARLFKALFVDNHNLVPKIAPQFVKSASVIKGDGGVGSVIQVNFGDDGPFPFMKYRIDESDIAQFKFKSTIIEGGELSDKVKSVSFENKLEPTADGGCLSKLKRVFTLAEGAELSPEELEGKKMRAKMLFDGVEGYLLKNPDAYA